MSKLDTAKRLEFATREDFRHWLVQHADSHEGIWIIGHKKDKRPTISYADALEEALCFGWIDGTVKSIDEDVYIRYFAKRNATSYFSAKNRGLIEKLESQGLITELGYKVINKAKQTGRYQNNESFIVTKELEDEFALLVANEGLTNEFNALSKSSKRMYLAFIASAKSEETKQKRMLRSLQRIKQGLALPA